MKGFHLLLLASSLCACATESEQYVIATAGPWNERYGVMNKRGIDLAVDEINTRGGVRGRQLVVVELNDEGDGQRAAAVAGEFVANRDIIAVVGHINSGAMVAAARVYDNNLPAVSTTASSPDLTGISPWVFRVISSDSVNGQALARFAGTLGRRAAILYENNTYGRGLTDAFRRSYRGEIVSVDPIADDVTEVEPYIAFLRSRTVDVVFVAGTGRSGIALLREARRQRFTAAFLGGDGWAGVVTDTAAAEGAYVGTPFTSRDPRPEAQRFVSAFRARYGEEPDANAALGYDATMVVATAIEKAGANRRAVRDYLASMNETRAIPGVTGSIRFRETGDVVGKSFVMTRVERGAMIVQRDGVR